MKHKYIFTAVLLFLVALISGISVKVQNGFGRQTEQKESISIVTSFYPMYIAVLNITKDTDATVRSLTEPTTGCLHDYQLTPGDRIALSKADVFVVNGGGMESFLDKVMLQYSDLKFLEASDGIRFLQDGEETNAHVWMDTEKYAQQIQNISNGLMKIDPKNKNKYEANAKLYLEQIRKIETAGNGLGEGQRVIIFHEAFAYVADEWGFDVKMSLEFDENTALSAGELADLITEVKHEKVQLILADRQYGYKIAESVAGETGIKICMLDSLVTGEDSLESYIDNMEKNIDILKGALK